MKQLFHFIFWPSLAGFLFALSFLYFPAMLEQVPALQAWLPTQQPPAEPAQAGRVSFSQPIKKAAPAVVSINYRQTVEQDVIRVIRPTKPLLPGESLQGYLDTDEVENSSLGSGVIISPDGFIVTSYHVVFLNEDRKISEDMTITLSDGRDVDGRLVLLDEKNDLALLKIDEENLPFLDIGSTSGLQVGDVVLAIGNPRNIGQSVSFGIISALFSRGDSFVIQTDAAINPGNSGGALIDVEGKLIGINSFIVSESGGSEGISFAVPSANVAKLLQDFMESGPSGYLGVDSEALSLTQGRLRYNQDVQGFLVNDVSTNSPADKAGIQAGDVISGIDGIRFSITNQLDSAEAFKAIGEISNQPPGKLVVLEVFRKDTYIQLPTILGIGEPQIEGKLMKSQILNKTPTPLIESPLPPANPIR